MQPGNATDNPDEYVESFSGWTHEVITHLRKHVVATGLFEERIKWGHLVFELNGPALLIRADEDCVMFGFWRGKRLRHIEPGLKPGGKYEMAKLTLFEGPGPSPETIRELANAAAKLNHELGNPQDAAK